MIINFVDKHINEFNRDEGLSINDDDNLFRIFTWRHAVMVTETEDYHDPAKRNDPVHGAAAECMFFVDIGMFCGLMRYNFKEMEFLWPW